jgi:hypothetical protein
VVHPKLLTQIFAASPGRVQTVDSTRHPEHPARHPVVWRMELMGLGNYIINVGKARMMMGGWRDERGEGCALMSVSWMGMSRWW